MIDFRFLDEMAVIRLAEARRREWHRCVEPAARPAGRRLDLAARLLRLALATAGSLRVRLSPHRASW